ncbi:MAG TPA: hypothetical protein VK327_15285 [Candidatus Paceibacterota bacterium]|nr:hypothetical protein [Candidatus Paceibacterota bacterium]
MFFYEWVLPFVALLVVLAAMFYFSVKNRVNAGTRTDGKTLFDKGDDE